jgi:hypothetical protein
MIKQPMEAIRQIQKKYCTRAITLAIITGLICILAGQKPVGRGIVLGTIFSIVNFIMMGEALPMRIGRSNRKTFFVSLGSIGVRYGLLAIPIVMAIKMEQFNLFSVMLGVFMIQIVLIGDHASDLISSIRKRH